ncbi:MAG: hypothetical protein A2Y98_02840 [Candidatus Portnoybacteria bacterium RBG_19FT_COMBO_36_7]|uniref:Uncharacterized protein n=1 Tax=Candidatus Portnoybacteria bacterium RBG_19FT_COMBO_36_7 TaxID=1801992 RepID=A0A1G2FA00_9BACT|nr:MAG: hypothetical protein A2Y98_02840 [Candidatus Portnoybacteria bacterium RBG_19FT_COMBO_36_7]
MEKCLYGKNHSFICISSNYDHSNGNGTLVNWCEVCGYVIKTEYVLNNGIWEEKNKTKKTPQIAKEIFAVVF